LERSYNYVQRDEERTLDSSGAVKRRESKTWDVVPLQGSQFRRLIQRDDKPMSPNEPQQQETAPQKREAARRKTAELRARETPAHRQKRVDAGERVRKRSSGKWTRLSTVSICVWPEKGRSMEFPCG